jgi:hypothetical protein
MQNTKCQLLWNDEIQNGKIFMGVFSPKCQIFHGVGESFLAFWLFFFLPLEAKIQNGEWIPFCQNFCMVFSSILQNDGSKPKIFWVKWETKRTHSMSNECNNLHRNPLHWTNKSSSHTHM